MPSIRGGTSVYILTAIICEILIGFASLGYANLIVNDDVWYGNGRSLLQANNGGNSSSMVLAEQRTRRQHYTGGWNISNPQYITSVFFTGAPLILVGLIWFVAFGIFLLLACMWICCCSRRKYGYSRLAYALSLILLILFTIAAVVGSIVLYVGQGRFHDSTSNTFHYVVGEAESTAEKLENVSSFLTAAKNVDVAQILLTQDLRNSIDSVNNLISSSAETLNSTTLNNKDRIFRIVDLAGTTLIIIAAVLLGLVLLGFVFSILGLQVLVYILVVIGWILIALTFIIGGIFVVLHNMVGDTCVAMDEWVNNPTAHTALDDIIPCIDPTAAQEALSKSREVTFRVVDLVNQIVVNVSNANFPPGVGAPPLNYNQSGPLVPLLCNPYSSNLSNRTCRAGEVDASNATQVWLRYECQVSSSNLCTTEGRLTPVMYTQMIGAVNVSYGLYNHGAFLVNLADCTFLRDVFTNIYQDHCPYLNRYTKWVYIGLAMASIAVALSLIFWVVYARERRHRKYTKLVDSRTAQD